MKDKSLMDNHFPESCIMLGAGAEELGLVVLVGLHHCRGDAGENIGKMLYPEILGQ